MADCLTVVQEALATVRKHASQSKKAAREQESRKGARRSIGKKTRTTPTSATVQKWSAAVRQAGRELGLKGFASVRKGTEFHSKATEIQLRRARDRLGGPPARAGGGRASPDLGGPLARAGSGRASSKTRLFV